MHVEPLLSSALVFMPSKRELRRRREAQEKAQSEDAATDFDEVDYEGIGQKDGEEEWCGDKRVKLEVKTSTLPGAGQGLVLASEFASKGTMLLAEVAVKIKRKEAKQIMHLPDWKNQHCVIQCNKDNFLDIRNLTLYKSNHAEEDQKSCNTSVQQTSNDTLTMIARRDIYGGEELLWQYAKNWRAGYTP